MVKNGLRINQPKQNKRRLIFILIAILLAVGAGGVAYILQQRSNQSQSTQTSENQVNYDYNDPSSDADREQQIPAKQQPQEPSQPSNMSVVITHAGQTESKVSIRALVEGATTGTCTLTLSKNGHASITKTAQMTVQASYTICQGFDIPAAEFGSSGEWAVSVQATNGAQSASAQTTVEVQK